MATCAVSSSSRPATTFVCSGSAPPSAAGTPGEPPTPSEAVFWGSLTAFGEWPGLSSWVQCHPRESLLSPLCLFFIGCHLLAVRTSGWLLETEVVDQCPSSLARAAGGPQTPGWDMEATCLSKMPPGALTWPCAWGREGGVTGGGRGWGGQLLVQRRDAVLKLLGWKQIPLVGLSLWQCYV